jgi:hypothetical protein
VAVVALCVTGAAIRRQPLTGGILFNATEQLGRPAQITQAEAVAVARQVSIISTNYNRALGYKPYLAQMRAANPALRLIVYVDGTFADSSYPEAWYGHTASRARLRSPYGNWLMDMSPGSPWQTDRVNTCSTEVADTGFDGCFLDVLGYGGVTYPSFVNGVVVHPGTTTPWTPAEWIEATDALAVRVRNAIGGRTVIANGLDNGLAFIGMKQHPATSELLDGTSGGMAEIFPSNNWADNVVMLATPGATIEVTSKADPSDRFHRFTLATFALGTNGADSYSFIPSAGNPDSLDPYEAAAQSLGAPTAACTSAGGAYVRPYAHGEAVANPGTSPVTVTLPRPMVNLDGHTVSSETLPAQSGDLLEG